MKSLSLFLSLALCAGLNQPLSAQEETTVKSADEITKQIVIEGRVAFSQRALPFKYNSTDLADEAAHRQLVQIALSLQSQELRDARFMIVGHTCDLGSDAYNLGLSKRRASAIKSLLLKAGITDDRILTDGKGESENAVPNTSDSNRAQNRRVEIKLVQR